MTVFLMPLALALSQQNVHEYTVRHVSATYLIGVLQPKPETSLLPKNVKVTGDATRNAIVLTGPADDVHLATELFKQFDVEPLMFRVRALVSVPSLDRQWTTDSTLYNNTPWSFVDKPTGISVEVVPRMNNKGIVEVKFTINKDGTIIEAKSLSRPGEALSVMGSGRWSTSERARIDQLLGLRDTKSDLHAIDLVDGMGLRMAVRVDWVKNP